jgi:CRP/FNR family cyclic AMP-dependent transcriptional regulator
MSTSQRQRDTTVSNQLNRVLPSRLRPHFDVFAAAARAVTYVRGQALLESDGAVDPGIVARGLIRFSVHGSDGRTAAIEYTRSGEFVGLPSIYFANRSHDFAFDASHVAVEPSLVLHFDRAQVIRYALACPEVAWELGRLMAGKALTAYETAQRLAFSSVTQRIADQIVILATPAADGLLQVQMTQQSLADSVGTVREVAARVLRALRHDALISVSRGRIRVLDIEGVRRLGSGLPPTPRFRS